METLFQNHYRPSFLRAIQTQIPAENLEAFFLANLVSEALFLLPQLYLSVYITIGQELPLPGLFTPFADLTYERTEIEQNYLG